MCTCTVSLVGDTCTSPGVHCPHVWLNLQDMDMLPKIEACMCVYIRRHAGLATATSHQDLLTRAREQGVCFHNAPEWSSWPVAITIVQHVDICIRTLTNGSIFSNMSIICRSHEFNHYVGNPIPTFHTLSLCYALLTSLRHKYALVCCSYELSSLSISVCFMRLTS